MSTANSTGWQLQLEQQFGAQVQALLQQHLADMYRTSPAESVHALDLQALQHPSIRFFSLWQDGRLLGTGAWKRHVTGTGAMAEIKSMRTADFARRQGVADCILRQLLADIQAHEISTVALETGSMDFFAPARALYFRAGFMECGPFADYQLDPHSVFMQKQL